MAVGTNRVMTRLNCHWKGYWIETLVPIIFTGVPAITTVVGKAYPRSTVSTRFPALPQEDVKVHFQGVDAPPATAAADPRPQLLTLEACSEVATISRIASTEAGEGLDKSLVGWVDPMRAASRATLVALCFRL